MSLSVYAKEFSPSSPCETIRATVGDKESAKQVETHKRGLNSPVRTLRKTFAAVTIAEPPVEKALLATATHALKPDSATNARLPPKATSQRPRAGRAVDVTLQSLLMETALSSRPIRQQTKNDSSRISKHNGLNKATQNKGAPGGALHAKKSSDVNANNSTVVTTRAGRKKMIVRPSDSNKKLSKLKKSVVDFRSIGEMPSAKEVVEPAVLDENVPSVENVVAVTAESPRLYERLKVTTDHETFVEMRELTVEMLSGLKEFQDRQYERNAIKARVRQRMYYGIKESFKYLSAGSKIRMLILARDLEPGPGSTGLDKLVDDLLDKARANRVPVICALTRKNLQKLTHKPSKVACVAIADPSGREQQFERLKELAVNSNPFTGLEPLAEKTIEDEQSFNEETLKAWTSTTRRGKFEFAVDKLF